MKETNIYNILTKNGIAIYFYKVKLLKNKEKFNQKEFECFDIKYKWFSFEEFQKDEKIQKVNSDIIQFVKSFDV